MSKRRCRRYQKAYPYEAESAPFVEKGIRPLVVALSHWSDLKVMFSCEGHPEDNTPFTLPYVAFTLNPNTISKDIIGELKQRLKGTGWGVFQRDDYGCTFYDPIQKDYFLDAYTIRPYKNRKQSLPVRDLAKLLLPNKAQEGGVLYYHGD